jgi:Mo-co oxidoreductase dimerisation domain
VVADRRSALAAGGRQRRDRDPGRVDLPGPITRVELSLTGEGDWLPAAVAPPRSPYAWQDWAFDWEANDVGRHTLRARATDAAGNVQPEVPPWNRLGYGNNAIEVVYVDVR